MCYVLDFAFMTQIKVCKFSEIPPTFQTINYLFFIEVDNANNYSILHNKKSRPSSGDFFVLPSRFGQLLM